MFYRKVQICKGKISFQVHSGWALTVCILLQKESFLLFSIYWTRKEKGHKTVGNFSQTSFRSGTRPLLSNNASTSSNIIHVGLEIRLRRVIKIYDNNKHTLNMPSKKYITLEYLLNFFYEYWISFMNTFSNWFVRWISEIYCKLNIFVFIE